MRGFLAKGTDRLEGPQNYTARKLGEISQILFHNVKWQISAACHYN